MGRRTSPRTSPGDKELAGGFPAWIGPKAHPVRFAHSEIKGVFAMKTKSWTYASKASAIASALLMNTAAVAQTTQPAQPKGETALPPAVPDKAPKPTLPAVSVDRCMAQAVGTASDPKTGAPVTASLDPQTGKPLCPSIPPTPQTMSEPREADQLPTTQRGQVTQAKSADIKVGASVYDQTGALVGKVDSVDANGAIVSTGESRAEIPLSSVGKNDKGLVITVTKSEIDAQAKKANPETKPKN